MKFIEESILEFKEVVYEDREHIFKLMEEKVPTYTRKNNERESA